MSCDTRISPGAARALRRAVTFTCSPNTSSSRSTGSPACTPARNSRGRPSISIWATATACRDQCFQRGPGTAERQQETVAKVLHDLTVRGFDAVSHRLVVLPEHGTPVAITQAGRQLSRADDVGDRDRHGLDRTQRSARVAQRVAQRDRLGIRLDSQLVGKELSAPVVRAEGFGAIAGQRLRAHQHAIPGLAKGFDRDRIGCESDSKRGIAPLDPRVREHVERTHVPLPKVGPHGLDPRRVLPRQEGTPRDGRGDGTVAARAVEVAAPQRALGVVDGHRARFQIDPRIDREAQLVAPRGTGEWLGPDPSIDQHGPQLAHDRLRARCPTKKGACPATTHQRARHERPGVVPRARDTRTRCVPDGRGRQSRRRCRPASRGPCAPSDTPAGTLPDSNLLPTRRRHDDTRPTMHEGERHGRCGEGHRMPVRSRIARRNDRRHRQQRASARAREPRHGPEPRSSARDGTPGVTPPRRLSRRAPSAPTRRPRRVGAARAGWNV